MNKYRFNKGWDTYKEKYEMEAYKYKCTAQIEEEKYRHSLNLELTKTTITFATETLKMLFILSGGTAAALLAFAGHLATNNESSKIQNLASGMLSFMLSAFCVALSFGICYSSQFAYIQDRENAGNRTRLLAFASAVSSYAFFLYGIWVTYNMFKHF